LEFIETKHFGKLLDIFETPPDTFNTRIMMETYVKVGEFDLIEHIVNKQIDYDKDKVIKEDTKTGFYAY